MQSYLYDFLDKSYHCTWIEKVGEKFYKSKGLSLDNYLCNLRDISIPMDELGLVICARMYHRHIGIILQNDVWCSRMDNDFDKCFIKLAFMGGVLFCDTAFDNEISGRKVSTVQMLRKFPSLDISPIVKPIGASGSGRGRGRKKKDKKDKSKSVSPVPKKKDGDPDLPADNALQ